MISLEHVVEGLLATLLGVLTYIFKSTKNNINDKIDKVEEGLCEKVKKIEKEQNRMNPIIRKIDVKLSNIETNIEWLKKNSK